ncbi:protein Son-like [Anopheles marshallii]|uniref:protein Son-like n=1 Tax=Anopheles marshallii TaxID=1521116 RepID=UPI00237C04B7|nr:protein Son-like [Anopheles marshallii]
MSAYSDAQDKHKGDKSQDIFPLNIKIKQEKTTSYEDSSKSETVDKLSIDVNLKNIFSTTITSSSGPEKSSEKVVDVKPAIEPLKSSNEILTELFRVFNAAPPEIIEDDSNDAVEQEKKKKKHKHKKKSKKKKGNESDSGEEEVEHPAEDGEKRVKKKKIKKEKDRDRKHEKHKRIKHRIGETLLVTVKQEPVDDVDKAPKQRDIEKFKENGKTKEVIPEETKQPLKGRIQIKSLKDSAIFKELATSSSQPTERHHERHHHERDKPSHHKPSRSELHKRRTSETEFSMSDDDENKKGRYYDFYQKKYNSFYAGFEEENERKRQDRKRDRHSEDRSRRHRSNTFSRSRSRSRSTEQIDKQKLLEIARKNAINMLKKGTLPGAQNLDGESKAKLISKMHASGKSIEELTAFCKKISHKDNANDLSSVSSDESDHDADGASKAFHHPFQLKESAPIVMNIRNATTIQPKSAEEKKALLMQFPVSSGAHHRSSETEWIPVEPKKALPSTKAASTVDSGGSGGAPNFGNKAKQKLILPPSSTFVPQQSPAPDFSVPQGSPLVPSIVPAAAPPAIPPLMQPHVGHMPLAPGPPCYPTNDTVLPYQSPYLPPGNSQMSQTAHPTPSHVQPFNNMATPDTSMNLPVDTSIPPPNMNPLGVGPHQESQQRPLFTPGPGTSHPHSHLGPGSDNIFNTQSDAPIIDVSQIVSQRLNAMRRLQENPSDSDARQMLYNTQKDMSTWASSKAMPGQFLGSTGVNCLSQRELAEGYQPWASRDMMKQTAPVTGGMGMHLLQKMGWQPGEGLGKEKNGSLQPLLLDVKLDKRGLGEGENKPRPHQSYPMPPFARRDSRPRFMNVKINTDGKHPVSILCEYATKHKWNPPMYELVHESGPGHAKSFIFKVLVNGLEYQPAIANNTKKEAKATAAKFCLQQLGVMIT